MDFGKSFSYPFEDKNWLNKTIIGAIVTAVPIVNFAWAGYGIDLLKNVLRGDPQPLPEWSDFGDKWVRGLMIFLASLVYAIPALVLACIPGVLFFIPAMSSQSGDIQDTMLGVLTGVGGLFACLVALYALLLTFIYPAVYIHYARVGTFGSFFEFGKIFKIVRADLGKYLSAWLLAIVAGFVVGLVVGLVSALLGFIPCIGWVISWILSALVGVYIFYVYVHLFGQYTVEAHA
jgi:hypothetical protein